MRPSDVRPCLSWTSRQRAYCGARVAVAARRDRGRAGVLERLRAIRIVDYASRRPRCCGDAAVTPAGLAALPSAGFHVSCDVTNEEAHMKRREFLAGAAAVAA